MLLVEPRTRRVYGNAPFPGGVLQAVGTGSAPRVPVYEGTLPDSIGLANTSVVWAGRGWSMVLLPVFAQRPLRLNLLFHESFHRLQDSLGMPTQSPTAGFLDTREGRIWFRLELRALVSALSKPVNRRAADLRNALVYRALRFALHPGEDSIEHALEWNEGLAEFTGTYASGADLDTAYLPGMVRADTIRPSFTRSFAYFTGPLYGILLSQKDAGWPRHITADDNFEGVVRRVYGVGGPGLPGAAPGSLAALRVEARRLAPQYGGAAIEAQEDARETRRQAKEAVYRRRLVQGPVLVLTVHGHMHVGFNPSTLFDLGAEGTVYPTMTMSDDWGTLEVTDGALFKDWHTVRVPLDDSVKAGMTVIKTPGWSLTLNPGWTLAPGTRTGDLAAVSR
jgi:hypothetical protein